MSTHRSRYALRRTIVDPFEAEAASRFVRLGVSVSQAERFAGPYVEYLRENGMPKPLIASGGAA